MDDVYESYRSDANPQVQETMDALYEHLREELDELELESKWGKPCFVGEGNVVSIVAHTSHVNLQFFQGAHFDDPNGALEGTGASMRHLKVHADEPLPAETIDDLLEEAVRFDAENG